MSSSFRTAAVAAVIAVAVGTGHGSGAGPRFYPDDPLSIEVDHQDAAKTRRWEIDLTGEIVNALFGKPGDPTPDVRARNINTIDEVPDSSWFNNRLGRRALTADEVGKGPDTSTGPASGTWTVTSSKSDGITPGFTIRDSAGQLATVTDEMLRAAVRSGAFGDPESEEFLVKALGERRDVIAKRYLPTINPITSPVIAANTFTFENLAVAKNLAKPPAIYRVAWSAFDNATGDSRAITETTQSDTRVPLPSGLPDFAGAFIKLEVSATGGHPSWEKPVHIYFQRLGGDWKLVGFERLPEAPA